MTRFQPSRPISLLDPIAESVIIEPDNQNRGKTMPLNLLLIIVLILLVVGALPMWSYSIGWGYQPFGVLGLILAVVLILALLGRI